MRTAFALACGVLPKYFSKFSRHDFTLPQLFACLVVKEQQRKTYRDVEALLRDAPHWCRDIGMRKVPDHNTLCRAFDRFVKPALTRSMLDLMARLARKRKTLKRDRGKPLAMDSSLFESRHVSRHFERRRRDTAAAAAAPTAKKGRVRGANASTAAAAAS